MVTKVKFSYWDYHPSYHKKEQDLLAKHMMENGFIQPECASYEDKEAWEKLQKFFEQSFNLDIIDLVKKGFKFTVESSDRPEELNDFFSRLLVLVKEKTSQSVVNHNSITITNENTELHKYNDCMVEEDCCTDELKRKLSEGWRIIAVCQQKGSRRPDYVLGRSV